MRGKSIVVYCMEIIWPFPKGLLGQYWVTPMDTDLPFFSVSGPDVMSSLPNKSCVLQGKFLEVLLVGSGHSGLLLVFIFW